MMAAELKFCHFLLLLEIIVYINICCVSSHDDGNYNNALRANRVYSQTFHRQMKTPVIRTRKVQPVMDIYCYEPVEISVSLRHLWTTVCFSFSLSPTASTSGYKFYHGSSEPEVFAQRGQASTSWADILSSSRTSTDICLSPVHRSCVSVDTMEWYKTQMNIVHLDKHLLYCFIAGVLIFFLAAAISRSVVLYYLTGISVGVLSSILIVCYLLARLFPKKKSILAVSLAAGSSVTLWVLRSLWYNLFSLVTSYRNLFIAYIGVSGVVSFAVCYYRGPITEPRLLDLIKWALQAVGLLLIYAGCQIPAFSATVIVLLLAAQYFF